MTTWFVCDRNSGAIVTGGASPTEADAQMRPLAESEQLYVVPDGAVGNAFSSTPDFTALKTHLRAAVDAAAGAFRTRFITDVPGQAQTYERKEAEARAWTDGADAAQFPFMSTEAMVRSIPIAQVRAEIMAQVNALTPLAALIEAHRVVAKQAIDAATTLPAIIAAAEVDWEGLLP